MYVQAEGLTKIFYTEFFLRIPRTQIPDQEFFQQFSYDYQPSLSLIMQTGTDMLRRSLQRTLRLELTRPVALASCQINPWCNSNTKVRTFTGKLEPFEPEAYNTRPIKIPLPLTVKKNKRGKERATTEWVTITSTPMFALLDDVLRGIEQAFQQAFERQADNEVSLDMCRVVEARMILSRMKRPAGWFVRFEHPAVASCLVNITSSQPLIVGWKPASVMFSYRPQTSNPAFHEAFQLDDSVLRVEGVHRGASEANLRTFFQNHRLADERFGNPAIQKVIAATDGNHIFRKPNQPIYSTFWVRFEDASWARAAVRERQGVLIFGHRVSLIQYPRQLIPPQM